MICFEIWSRDPTHYYSTKKFKRPSNIFKLLKRKSSRGRGYFLNLNLSSNGHFIIIGADYCCSGEHVLTIIIQKAKNR